MRVLHVIASLAPALGGPSKACVEMARAVARRGHEVAIYTTDFGLEGQVAAAGAPHREAGDPAGFAIHTFPVGRPRAWKPSRAMARALARDIAGFDLVHLHSLYLRHDWVTGDLCHRLGVPYLVRPHGSLDPYIHRRRRLLKWVMETAFQNRVLRRAAALHYTTEEEMQLATPYALGTRGIVVPLGLDAAEYDALPGSGLFRARHPEVGGRRIVLFLSRLHEKKGLDLLAPAFAEVARGRDDLHLVIAGPDGGVEARARGWLRAAGVLERTTFTGMIEGEEKLVAFAAAELFVLPSYSENFGIAVLEAMAAGLPVVVSDKVNLWREVVELGAGLVTPCDAGEIALRLARLLDDPAATRGMGALGRAAVRERFSWERIGIELEAVYAELAAGGRRSTK